MNFDPILQSFVHRMCNNSGDHACVTCINFALLHSDSYYFSAMSGALFIICLQINFQYTNNDNVMASAKYIASRVSHDLKSVLCKSQRTS